MNNQTKHTPAPWHTGGDGTIIYAEDGFAVANTTVYHGRHEPDTPRANARLIAAAPDLLAALRPVADLSAYECPFCDPDKITLQVGAEHNCSEVPDARTAIAKAEGSTDE